MKIPGKFSCKAKLRAKIRANTRKARRRKRQIAFHRRKYIEEMLNLFRDVDDDGRQKLEDLFVQTTGQSLIKLYEQRVIESLKKNAP